MNLIPYTSMRQIGELSSFEVIYQDSHRISCIKRASKSDTDPMRAVYIRSSLPTIIPTWFVLAEEFEVVHAGQEKSSYFFRIIIVQCLFN